MIDNKLLLTVPTNPRKLMTIFDEKKEAITKMTLISVDYPPLEIKYQGKNGKNEFIFGKKENQLSMYDVAGLIIDLISDNLLKNKDAKPKKIFLVCNDVIFMSNGNKKMVSINGSFDVLPEELISKVYVNFPDLKSVNLEELEEILTLSKDETAIKAFRKLGSYFTAKNYDINNNIFNLIEHQEKAMAIAKKVLLKKMIAWEIR